MAALPIAYHVKVHVKNSGTKKILFDEIQAAFVPSQGQPLIQRTFAYDKSKHESLDAYEKGDNKPSILECGESLDFDYTTDGYTREVLEATGKQPLQFHIVLFRSKSVIAGPYVADLPNLMDLPQYELTFIGDQKAKALSFRLGSGGR